MANYEKRYRNELHRPQLERAIPTAMLTAQVARLGYGEKKLLEALAGMWVSLLQLRRPAMSLLFQIFHAIQEVEYDVPFRLAPSLVALWSLVAVAPLLCSDLRACELQLAKSFVW